MHDAWRKSSSQSPLILFATPPPLEQLRALTIHISSGSTQTLSKFQPQVIKCREFIFTEPEVIGSPSVDIKDNCFHLVAQLSLLNSGRLQSRLTRVGLQVQKYSKEKIVVTTPYTVTPELYQACLRYTLLARISPNWNRAGQWLIQGRDFLTQRGCINAVKMDVTVQHQEMFFTLEATAVKFSPLQVTDLDLVGNSLQTFLTNPGEEITHSSIASDWCFVLPSMKRGRIMSICHDLPEDSPFMSYRDIKRHWKNTYGYRLPETEDNMNFYQIHFGPLGGKLFTYPEVCLRAREIQRVTRVDPKPILRAFIQDIQSKFSTICGYPMKLQSKAKFAVADLFQSGQREPASQPNLTSKMGAARPSLYRSKSEMDFLLSTQTQSTVNRNSCLAGPQPSQTTPLGYINEQTNGNPSVNEDIRKSEALQGNCQQNSKIRQMNQSGLSNTSKSGVVHAVNPNYFSCLSGQSVYKPGLLNNAAEQIRSINTSSLKSTPNLHTSDQANRNPDQAQAQALITPVQNFSQNTSGNLGKPICDFDTISHAIISASQAPVVRKLFPQFRPKKILQVQSSTTTQTSAPKIVPSFNKQRTVNASQVGDNTIARNHSIVGAQYNSTSDSSAYGFNTRTVYFGQPMDQVSSAATPSFQKVVPSFHQRPAAAKTGANVGPKSSSKGTMKSGKQNGQKMKSEKPRKRSKENKKEDKGESKKRKMKKAEA